MENDPRTPCARQTRSNGESFTCGGHYEVRIAAYFDRSVTAEDGVRLTFTTLGGGDGTEGVVINCTDCGEPAPAPSTPGSSKPSTPWKTSCGRP